jgi:hypothetical protein
MTPNISLIKRETCSVFSMELATMDLINTIREAEEGAVPRPSYILLSRKPKSMEWVGIHRSESGTQRMV